MTRTARANASLRVQVARAPPRAPTLASHGLNVRCKKTYRAAQRTNLMGLSLSAFSVPYVCRIYIIVLRCGLSPRCSQRCAARQSGATTTLKPTSTFKRAVYDA